MSTTVSVGVDASDPAEVWEAISSASTGPPVVRGSRREAVDGPRFDEDFAFTATFSLQLPSAPHPLSIGVVWSGRRFESGHVARRDGPLRIRASLSDLRVLPGAVGEEMFSLSCQPSTRHAAMYWELGWPSGLYSTMVFHSDPSEYVEDLARIASEAHGLRTYCESLWGESGPGQPRPRDDRFMKQFDHSAEIAALARRLGDQQMSLRRLSPSEVVGVLRMACDESAGGLAIRELGEQRFALCVRPIDRTRASSQPRFGSVWAAYAALADAAVETRP